MNEFKKVIEEMAALSLRCIALAYRSYEMENVPDDEEQRQEWKLPDDELVLLAIVGIKVHSVIHVVVLSIVIDMNPPAGTLTTQHSTVTFAWPYMWSQPMMGLLLKQGFPKCSLPHVPNIMVLLLLNHCSLWTVLINLQVQFSQLYLSNRRVILE